MGYDDRETWPNPSTARYIPAVDGQYDPAEVRDSLNEAASRIQDALDLGGLAWLGRNPATETVATFPTFQAARGWCTAEASDHPGVTMLVYQPSHEVTAEVRAPIVTPVDSADL